MTESPRSMSRKQRMPLRDRADLLSSIGPVEDLESYVRADWWRNIFNANYLRTDGDVVEDPDITTSERRKSGEAEVGDRHSLNHKRN